MSTRASPALRLLAIIIAIVVAIVVVFRSREAPPAALVAGSPPASLPAVSFSALVLELNMSGPAGQMLLNAVGAGDAREGTMTAGELVAVRKLRGAMKTLTDAGVVNFAGSTATVEIRGMSITGPNSGPTSQDLKLDLLGDIEAGGGIAVDAGFRVMSAEGHVEVLAEEWGLPLGTRRRASASAVILPGEALFMRRSFGGEEILVIVTAQVAPGGDEEGGGQTGSEVGGEVGEGG